MHPDRRREGRAIRKRRRQFRQAIVHITALTDTFTAAMNDFAQAVTKAAALTAAITTPHPRSPQPEPKGPRP